MRNYRYFTEDQKSFVRKVVATFNPENTNNLQQLLLNSGFSKTNGGFKLCYFNDKLAVKFPMAPGYGRECVREYEQWLAVPRSMRKYFPRIFAFKNGLIIQEAVVRCDNINSCKEVIATEEKYQGKLADLYHNHGHKNGQVKFFDWVYYRVNPYINTNERLPGSKRDMLNGL